MNIVLIGVLMMVVFMAAILSKKVSALTALVVVPVIFGFIAGFGMNTLEYAVNGILSVNSTVALLAFAILYFGVMLCTGLFDPLSGVILRFMKGDPLRVLVGTVILATLVSLDGDGTTTIMICCAALLPVYRQLDISRIYLALFIVLPNGAINLLPWGGPTARLMAVMELDSGQLLANLIPIIVVGVLVPLAISIFIGLKERKRLGIKEIDIKLLSESIGEDRAEFKRPQYIWFNFIMTVIILLLIIFMGVPGPLMFALGACLALAVNYHDIKIQRKVIEYNAEGIVNIVLMIMGAGVLMGILSESGMDQAMANALISVIPESWGKYFTFVLAVISGPAVWLLNNDAFYFGIFPVLAEAARTYGFTDMQIGLASLLGQFFRGFSPVVPALYFVCSYVDIEFSEFQKKAIPMACISFAVMLVLGAIMGIYAV